MRFHRVSHRLTVILVLTAILSILAVSLPMTWWIRNSLGDSARAKIEVLRSTRARQVTAYFDHTRAQVAALSAGGWVPSTIEALTAAYEDLPDDPLTDSELDRLSAYYNSLNAGRAGDGGEQDAFVPGNARTQRLQLDYVVTPADGASTPGTATEDDAGYDALHDSIDTDLVELTNRFGFDDLLLVDASSRVVVYSTARRVDFATNLELGPFRDSGLASAVDQVLTQPDPTPALTDFAAYQPAGTPTSFIAARVYDGTRVVGVLVIALGNDALTSLLSANGDWQDVGLGRTGETYVVGSDLTLRSEARPFLEDGGALEGALDPALRDTIEDAGTTVLTVPVTAAPIRDALAGDASTGTARNYLGASTLVSAAPIEVDGLNWAVVAEVGTSEAFAAVRDFERRTLIAGGILAVLAAAAGVFLATALVRPVRPIEAAMNRVGAGDFDVDLYDEGRDEFGDLARELAGMAATLQQQEAAIERSAARQREVLLAALPRQLADQVRSGGEDVGLVVRDATVFALHVSGLPDATGEDAAGGASDVMVEVAAAIEAASAARGVEHVNSTGDAYLGVAGLDAPGYALDDALQCIVDAGDAVAAAGAGHGLQLTVGGGLACGDVGTGLVDPDALGVYVWGEAARLALVLEAIAGPGQILLHGSARSRLDARWNTAPVPGLVDLTGRPVDAVELIRPGHAAAGASIDPPVERRRRSG